MMPHFIYGKDLEELSLQAKLLSCYLGTFTVVVFFAFENMMFSLFHPHEFTEQCCDYRWELRCRENG